MQSYAVLSEQVAVDSSLAAMVLFNRDNLDIAFSPLRPRLDLESALTSAQEHAARNLRCVGVVGLCGSDTRWAFKEDLEPAAVDAITTAFLEYLRVQLGDGFQEAIRRAEIRELTRLLSLPDTRI